MRFAFAGRIFFVLALSTFKIFRFTVLGHSADGFELWSLALKIRLASFLPSDLSDF